MLTGCPALSLALRHPRLTFRTSAHVGEPLALLTPLMRIHWLRIAGFGEIVNRELSFDDGKVCWVLSALATAAKVATSSASSANSSRAAASPNSTTTASSTAKHVAVSSAVATTASVGSSVSSAGSPDSSGSANAAVGRTSLAGLGKAAVAVIDLSKFAKKDRGGRDRREVGREVGRDRGRERGRDSDRDTDRSRSAGDGRAGRATGNSSANNVSGNIRAGSSPANSAANPPEPQAAAVPAAVTAAPSEPPKPTPGRESCRWAECLAALFYGFRRSDGRYDAEGHRRVRPVNPSSEAASPSPSSPAFAAEVEFTALGHRWRLSRDFASGAVQLLEPAENLDYTEVYRLPGNEPSEPVNGTADELRPDTVDVGTRLLGVSRSDFIRLTAGGPVDSVDSPSGHVTGGHVTGGHVTGGHVTGGHVTGGHVTGGLVEGLRLELERAATTEVGEGAASAALELIRKLRLTGRDRAELDASLPPGLDEAIAALKKRLTEADAEQTAIETTAPRRRELGGQLARLAESARGLSAEIEAAGGPPRWTELAELDVSVATDAAARETLRKLQPERDRLAATVRTNLDVGREEELRRAAEKTRRESSAVQTAEARVTVLEGQIAAVTVAVGSADVESLRRLPELTEQLAAAEARADSARPVAETAPTLAEPGPAGSVAEPVTTEFARSFARLSPADQERCRRAGPALRETARRKEQARSQESEATARITAGEAAYQSRFWPGVGLAGLGGLGLLLSVIEAAGAGDSVPGPLGLWLVVGLGSAAVAGWLLLQAVAIQREQIAPAEASRAAARRDGERADRDEMDLREQLRHAVSVTGARGPAELAERIRLLGEQPAGSDWLTACRTLAEAGEETARLRRQAHAALTGVKSLADSAGAPAATSAGEALTAERLRGLLPTAAEVVASFARRRDDEEELAGLRRELPGLWAGAEAAREALAALLGELGLDRKLPPDEAVTTMRAAVGDLARLRELDGHLIPEAASRKLSDEESAKRVRRRLELRAAITGVASWNLPAEATVAVCLSVARSRQAKLDGLERELAGVREEYSTLWNQAAVRQQALRQRRQSARLELERAERLDRVLRLARECLERARTAAYQEWHARLNQAAIKVFPAVLAGTLSVTFKPDLSFTLKLANGRTLQFNEIDGKFTTPTQQQRLSLAVRLTLSEALATACRQSGLPAAELPFVLNWPVSAGPGGSAAMPGGAGAGSSGSSGNTAPAASAAQEIRAVIGCLAANRQVCLLTTAGSEDLRRSEETLRGDPVLQQRLQLLRV